MPERENDEHWEDVIRSSSHGSDLLLNCLAAACASYRRATVCVPFPKIFQLSNNARDYSALQQCLDALPSLSELANTTSAAAVTATASLSSQQRALLDWTLTSHPRRKASAFQPISLPTFLNEVPSARLTGSHASNPSLLPHAVFRITPHAQQNGGHGMESDTPHRTITAFHGTSFENLHSILRSGLVPASNSKLERNGKIFGQGIYLSTELPVAYTFCAGAERWKGSSLAPEGTKLRCILVCSVRETAQKDKTDKFVSNKKNGEPPPAHYLVIDRPDLVKIQYILVYVDHCGKSPATAGQRRGRGGDGGGLFFSMVVGAVLIAFLFWLIMPSSSSNRRFAY